MRCHLELVIVRLAVMLVVVVRVVHLIQKVDGEPPAQGGLSHKHVLQEHVRNRQNGGLTPNVWIYSLGL